MHEIKFSIRFLDTPEIPGPSLNTGNYWKS